MTYDEAGRLRAFQGYPASGAEREPDFDNIAEIATLALDLPICAISVTDSGRYWFKSPDRLGLAEAIRKMSLCDMTSPGSRSLIIPDVAADARFANAAVVAGPPGFRFYAGVPLTEHCGNRVGTLSVLDLQPHYDFTDSKLAILEKLAATAIELREARSRNLRLVRYSAELAHLAHHDPLTGLENRRAIEGCLCKGIKDGSQDIDWALLYLDLDHFKTINDTLGHRAGDELLKEAAVRLRTCVRREDRIARLGGDEFAILLCGSGIRYYATHLAPRLIDALAAPYLLNGHSVEIGVSIGVAVTLGPSRRSPRLDDLLRNADIALYQAKNGGRNRYYYLEFAYPRVEGVVAKFSQED